MAAFGHERLDQIVERGLGKLRHRHATQALAPDADHVGARARAPPPPHWSLANAARASAPGRSRVSCDPIRPGAPRPLLANASASASSRFQVCAKCRRSTPVVLDCSAARSACSGLASVQSRSSVRRAGVRRPRAGGKRIEHDATAEGARSGLVANHEAIAVQGADGTIQHELCDLRNRLVRAHRDSSRATRAITSAEPRCRCTGVQCFNMLLFGCERGQRCIEALCGRMQHRIQHPLPALHFALVQAVAHEVQRAALARHAPCAGWF